MNACDTDLEDTNVSTIMPKFCDEQLLYNLCQNIRPGEHADESYPKGIVHHVPLFDDSLHKLECMI